MLPNLRAPGTRLNARPRHDRASSFRGPDSSTTLFVNEAPNSEVEAYEGAPAPDLAAFTIKNRRAWCAREPVPHQTRSAYSPTVKIHRRCGPLRFAPLAAIDEQAAYELVKLDDIEADPSVNPAWLLSAGEAAEGVTKQFSYGAQLRLRERPSDCELPSCHPRTGSGKEFGAVLMPPARAVPNFGVLYKARAGFFRCAGTAPLDWPPRWGKPPSFPKSPALHGSTAPSDSPSTAATLSPRPSACNSKAAIVWGRSS